MVRYQVNLKQVSSDGGNTNGSRETLGNGGVGSRDGAGSGRGNGGNRSRRGVGKSARAVSDGQGGGLGDGVGLVVHGEGSRLRAVSGELSNNGGSGSAISRAGDVRGSSAISSGSDGDGREDESARNHCCVVGDNQGGAIIYTFWRRSCLHMQKILHAVRSTSQKRRKRLAHMR